MVRNPPSTPLSPKTAEATARSVWDPGRRGVGRGKEEAPKGGAVFVPRKTSSTKKETSRREKTALTFTSISRGERGETPPGGREGKEIFGWFSGACTVSTVVGGDSSCGAF